MNQTKVKFAAQLTPDVLEAQRQMSAKEGRHLQAILDEALRAYISLMATNGQLLRPVTCFCASMAIGSGQDLRSYSSS